MIANNTQYTPFNKVSFITDGDYTFTFQYNSNHERVKMEVENDNEALMTKYYFGSSEIQETSEGTRTINHIGIGTGLLAMHVTHPDGSTEIIQCFTDRLGSPIVLANENGQEIGRYSYTPWGKQRDPYSLQTIGFSNQPVSWFHRGYTGHEMLYGIGIINMNGRIYDPHTHQFLSPDNYIQAPGFSQSFNRFAYCWNNPLVYTDPSGEIVFTIIGALLAPVTGGASLAIGIAMDVTAAVNVASNWNDINGVVGDGKINVEKFAMYYGIGSLNGATAATGQAWAICLTGSATSLLNSSVREEGFKNLEKEDYFSAGIDGLISYGGAKLTLPNSGESLFGFKHSSSNLNLSSKVSNKLFSSWGESALGSYLSDQIVKYPYTFVTGSLKYGLLSNDPNKSENMWKVGFSQANMGAIYDFGGMAYQSSVNMHYRLYQAEKNYQMSLDLSIQKARASTPGNNYNLNYNVPVQNYFYMPSVSPFFHMNFNIGD